MKKTFDALESKDFNEQELSALIHENNPMIYLYTRSFKLRIPSKTGRVASYEEIQREVEEHP